VRYEIVLAGQGGQGLIFAGSTLGRAAVLHDGLLATQTQSYGVASRGGFSKSEVIISDNEIHYPLVTSPDVVLCLSQEAYDRMLPSLSDRTLVVYSSCSVSPSPGWTGKEVGLPIIASAWKEFETGQPANVIALGCLAALTEIVRVESLQRVLDKGGSNQARQNNRALALGQRLVKEGTAVGVG